MIVFDEIPYDWYEKGAFLEVKPTYARKGIFAIPVKNLVISQKLATGTLAPATLAQITRPEEAISLFGLGSIGAEQAMAVAKVNKTQPLYVMALADAGGAVKATGTITFAGAISQAVVLRFKIGGKQVRFTANADDTMTDLATALAAAINADTSLTVTATSALGVVTVTARNAGEVGNEIDLRVDAKAQPLPLGLTATIVAMSGGSGNPNIETALDAVGNLWFTDVTFPWNDATTMAAVAAWATERYMAMERRDVHMWVGKRGTFGQLGTFGELTNSPFITAVGLNKSPTSAWTIAGTLMGVAAFHLANDPSRQLGGLVLPGVEAPNDADQFLETEREQLIRSGISSLLCLDDGRVSISRIVTTYRKTSLDVDDRRTWLDVMIPKTMTAIRYDWAAYFTTVFPRAKLADDESGAATAQRPANDEDPAGGVVVVTPRRAKALWAGRCKRYAERTWIEDIERTVRESVFERNADDKDRLDARQPVRIIGNMMVLAGSLEFEA